VVGLPSRPGDGSSTTESKKQQPKGAAATLSPDRAETTQKKQTLEQVRQRVLALQELQRQRRALFQAMRERDASSSRPWTNGQYWQNFHAATEQVSQVWKADPFSVTRSQH
jgi:hypothetical protein